METAPARSDGHAMPTRGPALAAVAPIAFAADAISIAVMEAVDNAIMLAVPGAMAAGLGDLLFWAPSPSPGDRLRRRSTAG